MAIVARNLEGVGIVAVSAARALPLPEAQTIFALYQGDNAKGARLLDDPALHMRSFIFPALSSQITFEPTRFRLDATEPKKPAELPLGREMGTIVEKAYPAHAFDRFGFNYDIAYQYDVVIAQREILATFLDKDTIEDTTHFGWQFTLSKDKGTRRETYFCKVVSPLEIRVLTNIEFDKPLPPTADLQKLYEKCYVECQDIVEHFRIK